MADSAPFKGVEVEVISNGQSLPLYDDPDAAENDELRTRQNYIEAVTGATFSIKVTLSEEFEMGRCDAARISMTCDNSERTSHKDVMAGSQRRIGPLQDRQVVFCRMSGFCQDSGQWKSGKYCFGKLVMVETLASDLSPVDIQKLGQIQLKINRVMLTERTKTPSKTSLKRVGEVSEKVMKGKAIENTIDGVDYRLEKEPKPRRSFRANPIYGPLGQPLRWNLLYRSKRTLGMLGCIPRTPSPDLEITPESKFSASSTSVKAESTIAADREQEVKGLRARLALLESETNIKSEHPNTRPQIKRERDDQKNTDSRKKPRGSASIEVVDLTAD